MSSNDDELSSNTSSSCDVESQQLVVEGKGSLNLIVWSAIESGRGRRRRDEERYKDDEDGARFVTLESRFENKETVLNW